MRGLKLQMSASREKKQRQDDPNQGLTQKQIKERKEAAIKKRKRNRARATRHRA